MLQCANNSLHPAFLVFPVDEVWIASRETATSCVKRFLVGGGGYLYFAYWENDTIYVAATWFCNAC